MMNAQTEALATQRHDMDLAASRQRIAVERPRAALSTRLGHVLVGAGSRLLAERRAIGHAR